LGYAARLEGSERPCTERTGYLRRLQARALGRVPAPARPRLPRLQTSPGDRPHALGHALPRGRALALRRLPEPERARLGPGRMDRGEPAHREHRRRALVRVRHPPHHPAGGLAGDAERHRLVLAQAVRVLRPQPGPGRAPEPPGPVTPTGRRGLTITIPPSRPSSSRPQGHFIW